MAETATKLLPIVFVILCSLRAINAQSRNLVRSRNSNEWHPRTRSTVCIPRECKLPECYCAGKTGPSHLRNYQIPQMVMLTFDDAINEQVYGFYEKLLSKDRLNPNGCPISLTFYLSHNWTDYDMVEHLYESGNEMASHSITHRLPQSWWTHASLKDWYREIGGQKRNIVNKAHVPRSEVKGMRVPFLELGGDKQFKMMTETGLEYDSSFMTGPYDEGGAWPFTLDYPPNWKYCSNNNCPKSPFPGVWELPMNRWIGPDGKPCPMVDACQAQPVDKEDALGYMWYNFNRFYRGNRAPFGIHLHAVWFKNDESYFDALLTFLDALSEMDDVYLVSASQIIAWMRNPTSVSEIRNFLPWRRTCLSAGVQHQKAEIPTTKPQPSPTTSTTTTTTTTTRATTTSTLASTTTDAHTRAPSKPKGLPAGRRKDFILVRAPSRRYAFPDQQNSEREYPQVRPAWLLPKPQQRTREYTYRKPEEVPIRTEPRRDTDLPSHRSLPVREGRYPPQLEQPRERLDEMASSKTRTIPIDQPKKAHVPTENDDKEVFREKIQVEINVNDDGSPAVKKQEAVSSPKGSHDDEAPIARSEKVRIQNAYESSREEAAEKTYFHSKRSGSSRLQSDIMAVVIAIVLLKKDFVL